MFSTVWKFQSSVTVTAIREPVASKSRMVLTYVRWNAGHISSDLHKYLRKQKMCHKFVVFSFTDETTEKRSLANGWVVELGYAPSSDLNNAKDIYIVTEELNTYNNVLSVLESRKNTS